ncbi:hypothetical protein [Pedobacter sp. GR22-10]|uniref:hypothetical protein n=1 Tax=Pedobacter sp. GR22-10 TaxID=2994472 RepID=UPI00224610F5|nr:hypothetical protein [Pedobacter sp. GR22-10]MCX2429930.1 hypothetical protein [Pedobacter sp. GR22-10]
MYTEEDFLNFANGEGGLIDAMDMSTNNSITAKNVERKFKELTEMLHYAYEEEARDWIASLRLVWINNSAINAVAFPTTNCCYIALYMGVVERLKLVFFSTLLHPFPFSELFQDLVWSKEISWDHLTQFIIDTVTGDNLPSETILQIEREIDLPSYCEHKSIALELYDLSVDFILIHEIQHFWLGHIYALSDSHGMFITEAPINKQSFNEYSLRRMMEVHADIYASRHAFMLIQFLDGHDQSKAAQKWWVSIAIFFMALEPNPVQYSLWNMEQYPHPHLRLASLFNYSQVEVQRLGFSDEEASANFKKWVNVLTRIEALTKGKVIFPFMQMINSKDYFDSEINGWTNKLKSEIDDLEKSKSIMIEHFRTIS